jgi:hypothetical protein
VSVDTTLIGETAASLMDSLPDETEGAVEAVGIVVVVDCGEEGTYTRIKCSSETHFHQLGLFTAALDCARHGEAPDADGGD